MFGADGFVVGRVGGGFFAFVRGVFFVFGGGFFFFGLGLVDSDDKVVDDEVCAGQGFGGGVGVSFGEQVGDFVVGFAFFDVVADEASGAVDHFGVGGAVDVNGAVVNGFAPEDLFASGFGGGFLFFGQGFFGGGFFGGGGFCVRHVSRPGVTRGGWFVFLNCIDAAAAPVALI